MISIVKFSLIYNRYTVNNILFLTLALPPVQSNYTVCCMGAAILEALPNIRYIRFPDWLISFISNVLLV